ncbi:hypothetical protein O6H91_13G050000 [Diphasiastrum complanatum]|uniref:Uncharacterized protein n=1 Tax=Diphasiastrum complanatum TaxID=34168 RepID=A0ACC2BUK3_DIPCM|nr:hypothetical protein O6H91_13G050000 [Diphasiastrum complanatum]
MAAHQQPTTDGFIAAQQRLKIYKHQFPDFLHATEFNTKDKLQAQSSPQLFLHAHKKRKGLHRRQPSENLAAAAAAAAEQQGEPVKLSFFLYILLSTPSGSEFNLGNCMILFNA